MSALDKIPPVPAAASRPPAFAEWVLKRFLLSYSQTCLPGDLEEEFRWVERQRGVRVASRWYRRQVAKSIPYMVKNITYWSLFMIKNYFKIAWRNIRRYKAYSTINIAGLAVGMACSFLILLWVHDELSYDRFHENSADIYRVIQKVHFTDHDTIWAITQGPLGPALKAAVPEIVEATRITWVWRTFLSGERQYDERLGMADGSIFSMFTFPLLQGDPATALENPSSIVLSEDMARKYFPGQEAMGKTVRTDQGLEFRVTGVMRNNPRNSHLRFDFLIPFIFGRQWGFSVDSWNNSGFSTYIRLQKGLTAAAVLPKIENFLADKPTLEKGTKLALQPLGDVHLRSHYEFDEGHGNIQSVRVFSLVAVFILAIACINFMNLTTARSASRAREVGLRKVSGAHRGNLIRQFYGEALILIGCALILALILVRVALTPFSTLAAKELSFSLFASPLILAGLAGIVFVTGLFSGSYPSLFLSRFQPAAVLRGTLSSGSGGRRFRKTLVVFQFSLTVLLLIGTFFVFRQLNFMRRHDVGYDKNHVIYARMRGDMRDRFDAVRSELLRDPRILGVTAGSNVPTRGVLFSNSRWKWEGKNPADEILMRASFVDIDYFEVLGLTILAGRSFEKKADPEKDVQWIVNEEAAKAMNFQNPVGRRLFLGDAEGTIVGLVKNHHFTSLRDKIDPQILGYLPSNCRVLFVRLRSDGIPEALRSIEAVWKRFAPNAPFDFSFLDDAVDNLYWSEQRTGTIFGLFAALAVLVSCLGLFGLASFLAEQKTREIGIRKVLGASVSGLIGQFSLQFVSWVVISNLIAWPVAYLAVRQWLRGFAYRIAVGPGPFLAAAGLALLIAVLTVSYHSLRAARSDPAQAIRYE